MNPLTWFSAIPSGVYIAFAVLLSLGTSYGFGYEKGHTTCIVAEAQAVQKGVRTNETVERKVMVLSDPDLDSRLSKWMRD